MRRLAPLLPLLLLLVAADALARVGGGQDFGGGGGGSGGGSYGGGGGDGGGDVAWFLFWLIIHHPTIGVPVTVVVVVVFLWMKSQQANPSRPTRYRSPEPVAPRRTGDLDALRAADPSFSRPLFVDFAQLVYTRGLTLRGRRELLRPYFSAEAQDRLEQGQAESVRDIIFGATRVERVSVGATWTTLVVHIEANFTEQRGGTSAQIYAVDRWVFRRRAGVVSPDPERMHTLGCAACGSTAEPRADGTCTSCDAVRTGGTTQWEVSEIQSIQRRPLGELELHLGGGVEPGTHKPTVLAPDLLAARRAFEARHPEHDWGAFKQQVESTFRRLQEAWSSGRWEAARPLETDALFGVHRFWMDRYKAAGLRNRSDGVKVTGVQLAAVETDRYYEALTVRVFATMLDWTEDGAGKVVSGSKSHPRTFTEYWTFLRAAGASRPKAEAERCPSCGAPLDRVSAAGVCGYCDAKITTGEFGWVLSRIEQDDVYAG